MPLLLYSLLHCHTVVSTFMMARLISLLLPLISLLLLHSGASAPSAEHTLGTGSSLSVEDNARPFLVSPDASFSCGFLQAGDNAFYFSIWFTASKNRTAVWSANTGDPVNGRFSRISFSRDGKLALADANRTTVWDSKTGGNNRLTVSLNDTGNLVITDPSTGRAVWQSFDWPTDTLLPSQVLSRSTILVAGYYSLRYDTENVLRLVYDGPDTASIYWPDPSVTVYASGRTNYNSSRVGVLDDTGAFRSSDSLSFEASDLGAPGVKRRLTIEKDGNLRLYSLVNATGGWTVTWMALKQPCLAHGLCGKNALCEYQPSLRCSCAPGYEMVDRLDWRKGCNLTTFSLPSDTAGNNCSQGVPEQYTFVKVSHTDFYGYDLLFNMSFTFENCMDLCLQLCSCAAFSYRLDGLGKCWTKGVLFNGYTSSSVPGTFYLKVPTSKVNASAALPLVSAAGLACTSAPAIVIPGYADLYGKPGSGPKWTYFFAFAAVLGFLELLIFAAGWWFLSTHESIPSSLQAGYRLVMATQFKRFSYRELKNATGNFKEELGRGGSGVVYRGVLDNGTVVAVKKLTDVQVQGQGEEEFWAEVTVFGRINHINLVRIWGYCSEGKHRMLVYEYVENESLDRHLFGTDIGRLLAWTERFKIALGAARGLAYLHHECLEWVIHCDVKPENILLTRDLDAKIADFGLAKLAGRDVAGDGMQFSRMRGTTGYMAPEWALGQPVDAKVDVYSYGIVLLEILIGTRVSDQTTEDGGEQLEVGQIAQALKQLVATGDVGSLVDSKLNGQFNPRQAMEMVKISLKCMEEKSSRPTMDDISKALTACDEEDEHPAYLS